MFALIDAVDPLYLVVCTADGLPAHAWIIEAETADVASAVGRYRYGRPTGLHYEDITARTVAYADLPEIMFGDSSDG